jgi:two-component system chemotaxis sensor kinase CheA
MDDLLTEFLAESAEHIDAASMELVRIEKDPADPALIASLFRHIHTIKGSSGFLSLPRVGRLAHGAEALIGRLRDGAKASGDHISLILAVVDRLSALLVEIGRLELEPEGDDSDILSALDAHTKALKPAFEPQTLAPAWTPPAPEAEHGVATPTSPAAPSDAANANARTTEMVRVSVGVLDRLMGIVSELVLTRNQLLELSAAFGDERVKGSVQNLSTVTSDLQDAVMRVRMQPLDKLFATLPRLVRDLSLELNKRIKIETFGAETELDRQVIELMRAPLTHIIRNAADHGIESAAQRAAAGKSETGVIRVTAAYDAGQITLEIKDDGRGFDVVRIKKKAYERGLVSAQALEKMTDAELYPLVLLPGFSTAEQVSKVSGRGVGMDVVRDNIQSIGGTVTLASRSGSGTTVMLRIPLTLAIAPALILACGGSRFAIPQMAVVEVVGIGEGFESDISLVYGAPMLRLRGEALPLACLAQTLDIAPPGEDEIATTGYAVILRVAGVRCGLLVETIADVQEVVIEPLVGALARLGVFSGQTILGDGSAVLILDPAAIVDRAGIRNKTERREQRPSEAFQPEKMKTCVVLLRAGAGPLKALPLSLIMRIEEVDGARLARSGDAYVLPYEGRLMPVIRASDDMAIEARAYPILVLAGAGQAVGLLVEEIIDVVEEALEPQLAGVDERVVGVVNLRGQTVELLDMTYFINRADPGALARGVNRRPRILLVDDKQFFRDMLSPVLSAAGFEVTASASGLEALALIEKGLKIDILVTDIDMPDMDGYSLTRQLLAHEGCANIPVVTLAPQATVSIREAARACGARAVVGKFDRRALVEVVASFRSATPTTAHEIEQRIMTEIAA